MSAEDQGFYMRKDDACRRLGVSRKVLTGMVDSGTLSAYQLTENGNHYLIREQVETHVRTVKEAAGL